MRRALTITLLAALLFACGDDTTPEPDPTQEEAVTAWLDQWDDGRFDRIEEHNGTPVGISETERNVYTEDCDLLDQLISQGGQYGPSERDPDTLDYTPGYGGICDR